jgi:anaerobic selenocysteine-containing dehydrogenase
VLGQAVTPPGTARPDWIIASELARRLGGDLRLESVDEIWDEIEELAPSHAGVTLELLRSPDAADGVVVPLGGAPVTTTPASAEGPALTLGEAPTVAADELAAVVSDDASDDGDGSDGDSTDDVDGSAEADGDEATEPEAPAKPAILEFSAPPGMPEAPPNDAYSLRLVATRKLYDQGTLVQHAQSIAGLAPSSTTVRVHPQDFEHLGMAPGDRARATSARGSIVLAVQPDAGVPRGSAVVGFNVGSPVGDLIDASLPLTEIRLEAP